MTTKVVVLVGSLRKDSLNRKIAHAAIGLAPKSMALEIVEIGNLPFYNQDEEGDMPAVSKAFKAKVEAADAVLFVTPEYNRSVPGVLKNAIDVASRPYGKASWANKPAAIISGSMGAIGGFGANHHLRQTLAFFNMPVMGQPEAYIGATHTLFDDKSELTNDQTRDFLKGFMTAFESHIKKNS